MKDHESHAREGLRELATRQAKTAAVEAMRAGLSNRRAAAMAGVVESTLYRWIQNDPRFVADMERARADRQAFLLDHLKRAIEAAGRLPGNWKAALALLEREYPEEFAAPATARTAGVWGVGDGSDLDLFWQHVTGASPNPSNEEDQ